MLKHAFVYIASKWLSKSSWNVLLQCKYTTTFIYQNRKINQIDNTFINCKVCIEKAWTRFKGNNTYVLGYTSSNLHLHKIFSKLILDIHSQTINTNLVKTRSRFCMIVKKTIYRKDQKAKTWNDRTKTIVWRKLMYSSWRLLM